MTDGGDYHQEMNTEVFMEWFRDLVRNLPEPSVIVLDNASYHNAVTAESKAPNMNSLKQVMIDWLTEKNIPHNPARTKKILYDIIKDNKPPKIYQTDVIANEAGHVVLRTPPRQCELNAIELIWALVKTRVARKNKSMKMKDVLELARQEIRNVTPAEWAEVVRHTHQVEKQHWKNDGLTAQVAPMIIPLGEDSDDSDDDSYIYNSDHDSSDNDTDIGTDYDISSSSLSESEADIAEYASQSLDGLRIKLNRAADKAYKCSRGSGLKLRFSQSRT